MDVVIGGATVVSQIVRVLVATIVVLVAIVAILDWLVHSRRINAFHPVARFLRQTVSPILNPVERQVVRAGGLPSSAPLWALAFAIIFGIVIVSLVDTLLGQVAGLVYAFHSGPGAMFRVLVGWTFFVLRAAVIVTVLVSWLPISPFSKWVRWATVISEPILAPLRQVLPRLGAFDISPIVAYFLLSFLERIFMGFQF